MHGSKRGLVKLGLAWNIVGWALVLLIILNAGVLGDVVLIAESDVWIMVIGAVGGVLLTLNMASVLRSGKKDTSGTPPKRPGPTDRW